MSGWIQATMQQKTILASFFITDTSSVAGKEVEHSDSKKFDEDSHHTTATRYKQASSSNPEPLALAGGPLTPSTLLAHGFSLTSKPSSSNSEEDEMLMRAIALSLGENISEPASALDSTSESNSGTASKPQQQPNVLEAEKDDPNNPR